MSEAQQWGRTAARFPTNPIAKDRYNNMRITFPILDLLKFPTNPISKDRYNSGLPEVHLCQYSSPHFRGSFFVSQ